MVQVSASWVLETDQYNEWMNEEDYEVDEGGKKKVHRVIIKIATVFILLNKVGM